MERFLVLSQLGIVNPHMIIHKCAWNFLDNLLVRFHNVQNECLSLPFDWLIGWVSAFSDTTTVSKADNHQDTVLERCRFWPNCKNPSCSYVHPSKTCRWRSFFPQLSYYILKFFLKLSDLFSFPRNPSLSLVIFYCSYFEYVQLGHVSFKCVCFNNQMFLLGCSRIALLRINACLSIQHANLTWGF